ncbi:pentatricopeptide repeat-containing protein At5g66520-like [Cajanus cajan]|uniref:pentatricopeptide repeat-containing protein At5g66520-like n=1 Tax=Cajanus cajan TaxID=3821 RepID=UPI00098DC8AC|nr:pentatricopeptide repeat-containing protein At5g66520-like [Cajanus cajan]
MSSSIWAGVGPSSMAEVKQQHSVLLRRGLSSDNHAMSRIFTFCSLSNHGDINYALKLLATLPNPDTFLYNTLFKAFNTSPSLSLSLYSHMLQRSLLPNAFTFPPLLKSSSNLHQTKQLHAHIIKFGFASHIAALNNLVHVYFLFGSFHDARRVFHTISHPDVVSWTTLVSGYSLWGHVDEAFRLFQLMPCKNSVSWNAMISCFVKNNRFPEAFELFRRMREEGVEMDRFVAATMLSACTGVGALEQGKWIHGYVEKAGIVLDSKLGATIVDMYCKCGCLDEAFRVFCGLKVKGLSSWNCMIGGFAMHGKGKDAISLFSLMEEEAMVVPDGITFVNVLAACAHSGLVEEGRYYFRYMVDVRGVEPAMEHYGCMVDLLARAGRLEEAKKVVEEMPMSPDASVLGALLGACRIHGNFELGEEVGKRVIELDPGNSGRYVMLGNIYASSGKWEQVASVRKWMDERGVKKEPGFSIIEMEGVVNEFVAGGRDHPLAETIYDKVYEMLESIRVVGYVPDTDDVLHDLVEEERENPLFYHSEKLAIAYGLLKTKRGETLRVTKNLRVCKDCHQASKLISKVYGCDIIIRDRNRFHQFSNGECSCKDYW